MSISTNKIKKRQDYILLNQYPTKKSKYRLKLEKSHSEPSLNGYPSPKSVSKVTNLFSNATADFSTNVRVLNWDHSIIIIRL